MNIEQWKEPKLIHAFKEEKEKLAKELSAKLNFINQQIRNGERDIDIPYTRLWINANNTYNEITLYTMHLYKKYYENLNIYKKDFLENKKGNEKAIEDCDIMIAACSDLFDISFENYNKTKTMLEDLRKHCDKLESDKNLTKFMKEVSMQSKSKQIFAYISAFDKYQKEVLLPLGKELADYMKGLRNQGFQFNL